MPEEEARLYAELAAHLKSIEVNMSGGFDAINKRLDKQNGTIARLNEAEVRRDERERAIATTLIASNATAGRERENMHWWVMAALVAAGLLSGIVATAVSYLYGA